MPSATYTRNPIVHSALLFDVTGGSGLLYTAPANGYAKVNISLATGTSTAGLNTAYVVIGTSSTSGSILWVAFNGTTVTTNVAGGGDATPIIPTLINGGTVFVTDVVIGPGQTLYYARTQAAATATGRVIVNGVEFRNG
jgi:hypothetical protein